MNRTATAAALLALALGATACGAMTAAASVRSATSPPRVRSRSGCRTTPRSSPGARRWSPTGTPKNPKEKVTAQEIPAGKSSEEVIGAAITAGNAPCLVFNTSPAAVPQFQKQGGLVAAGRLPGRARSTSRPAPVTTADAVQVAGREVLPDALEVQPGDDLLQQGPDEEGRRRPGEPAAVDVRRVPRHQREDRVAARRPRPPSGRRRAASSSSPGSTSTRSTRRSPAASSWSRTASPRSTTPPARRS